MADPTNNYCMVTSRDLLEPEQRDTIRRQALSTLSEARNIKLKPTEDGGIKYDNGWLQGIRRKATARDVIHRLNTIFDAVMTDIEQGKGAQYNTIPLKRLVEPALKGVKAQQKLYLNQNRKREAAEFQNLHDGIKDRLQRWTDRQNAEARKRTQALKRPKAKERQRTHRHHSTPTTTSETTSPPPSQDPLQPIEIKPPPAPPASSTGRPPPSVTLHVEERKTCLHGGRCVGARTGERLPDCGEARPASSTLVHSPSTSNDSLCSVWSNGLS